MRHRIIAFLFYALYLLAMIRPLHPLMEYYANYDYIAKVLCENKDKPALSCNGKCYLIKQVKKNTPIHSHNEQIPLINMDDYPISLVDWVTYDLHHHNFDNDVIYGNISMKPQTDLHVLLQPPRA